LHVTDTIRNSTSFYAFRVQNPSGNGYKRHPTVEVASNIAAGAALPIKLQDLLEIPAPLGHDDVFGAVWALHGTLIAGIAEKKQNPKVFPSCKDALGFAMSIRATEFR
jgi:hypothetical protein